MKLQNKEEKKKELLFINKKIEEIVEFINNFELTNEEEIIESENIKKQIIFLKNKINNHFKNVEIIETDYLSIIQEIEDSLKEAYKETMEYDYIEEVE